VALIHWDAPEAEPRVARLAALGYAATAYNRAGPALLRAIRAALPLAVLIDLSRLPAQGRDVGVALRLNSVTRPIPLVFVDGLPEKVLVVKQTLPDAFYTTWTHLAADLPVFLSRPLRPLVVPESALAGYAGKSLAVKLGVQPNTTVALLNAPSDFAPALEPLPAGVTLARQMSADADLTLWFVRARRELADSLALRVDRLAASRLWIIWPKKTSGINGDLTQQTVRDLGLAAGLVDYKIASVDPTWSGLLFKKRS
jgi:hypothetical protein